VIDNVESNNRFLFVTKKENQERIEHTDSIGAIDVMFLKEYPIIREFIISAIKSAQQEKNSTLDYIRDLNSKLQTQATIEIDLPPTNNQQTIEVTEENDQKIGTIKFGDIALKIITDSETKIEFKNRLGEDIKVKRK